jgi:hypothetical protein
MSSQQQQAANQWNKTIFLNKTEEFVVLSFLVPAFTES